ncbi:MAG: PTS sugar transporter subunit IIA [Gemmatimonadota bacterium]
MTSPRVDPGSWCGCGATSDGSFPLNLLEFLADEAIALALAADTRATALRELVAGLGLPPEPSAVLYRLLVKREALGSTGIGGGVAIPHCRSLVVDRLRIAYGRPAAGIGWEAVDGELVHHLFLIVAPPVEISNQYLPVLGRLAQFCRNPANLDRLAACGDAAAVRATLAEADA